MIHTRNTMLAACRTRLARTFAPTCAHAHGTGIGSTGDTHLPCRCLKRYVESKQFKPVAIFPLRGSPLPLRVGVRGRSWQFRQPGAPCRVRLRQLLHRPASGTDGGAVQGLCSRVRGCRRLCQARIGLPRSLETEWMVTGDPASNWAIAGAALRVPLLVETPAVPVSASLRLGYMHLLGADEANLDAVSMETLVSRTLGAFTPYFGVGGVVAHASEHTDELSLGSTTPFSARATV